MRLGVVFEPNSNAHYRAIEPMKAMERRGHEVVWMSASGRAEPRKLFGCDLVHVYRRSCDETYQVISGLARQGTAVIYDNDDDFTAVPKESPDYKKVGGLNGQRIFQLQLRMARLAHALTTTGDFLAEKYRQAGVHRVEIIGNHLSTDAFRPRYRHDGIVIGWIAGVDHRADVARIPIVEALTRIMEKHPQVRVETVGVDLKLRQRYKHEALVPFQDLPRRIGGYDIGIAPLADIPCNWARSDIKVKEYAASAVPWLASPIGPYRGLGEKQGGRLVPDDGWFDALDHMVSHTLRRLWLARSAKKWAQGHGIDAVAGRWEALFSEAVRARTSSEASLPATSARTA